MDTRSQYVTSYSCDPRMAGKGDTVKAETKQYRPADTVDFPDWAKFIRIEGTIGEGVPPTEIQCSWREAKIDLGTLVAEQRSFLPTPRSTKDLSLI